MPVTWHIGIGLKINGLFLMSFPQRARSRTRAIEKCLVQSGIRLNERQKLGGEEWVTLAGCLRRVSVICWYRRLWSGLTWGGRKGLRIETMVMPLLTFPQGHQGLKGQKHVFNNFPCPELKYQADRNGGYETSTRLAASELPLPPK